LGANVPGNPSVIVQNMPGAGGFNAVNHVYNVAPKDGTQIILTASVHATAPSLGNKAARWDMFKLQWLGNLTRESASCVVSDISGVKSIDEAKRARDHLRRQRPVRNVGHSAADARQPRRAQAQGNRRV
jgi:tripartite-type tricarboxylate transporter receptor subunit TctC